MLTMIRLITNSHEAAGKKNDSGDVPGILVGPRLDEKIESILQDTRLD